MWCFDRWLSRERAQEMQHWYIVEGASESYVVPNPDGVTFGVLYEAPIPFSSWHAFGGDSAWRRPAGEVDFGAVLARLKEEAE